MKKDILIYLQSKSWQFLFFEFSTYLFVGTLPLFLKLNTISLWIFIVGAIISSKERNAFGNLRQNKIFIFATTLIFSLYVIGFFLSTDSEKEVSNIIRLLPLFVLPMLIFSFSKKDFNFRKTYLSLGTGLILGMLYCWCFVFTSILSKERYFEQAKYFFEWIYTDVNLLRPLEGHPSYFAVLIVVFLITIITSKKFSDIRKKRIRFSLILMPYILFLIETNSRIGIISFVVLLSIYVLKTFKLKKSILIVLSTLLMLVLVSIKFNYLGTKMGKLFDSSGSIKFERYHRWTEILNVFSDSDEIIFGVGTSDARLVYQKAYFNGNFELALRENYNAHNQFLEFFVSNGVFGLFIYLICLCLLLFLTKYKWQPASFIIVILLFSFSESFFGRSQGVLMFSFFYSFLALLYTQNNVKYEA